MTHVRQQPLVQYNLILVSNPAINTLEDFTQLADYIREIAPNIRVIVTPDNTLAPQEIARLKHLPTLTFSPGPLRNFRPGHGQIFQGLPLKKNQEYSALESINISIPRWTLLTQYNKPDLENFGSYVVVKPDRSGRGADVKIKRKGRVKWKSAKTDFTKMLSGNTLNWIVQDFIYTGKWPVSYRVTTLFGEPLWAWQVEASRDRRTLKHRFDFCDGEKGGGMSIVSSGKGSVFSLYHDHDVLTLAKRAHKAFPTIPLLGVDIIREADTGKLYVIEVNAVGYTWHFSSPIGKKIQADFNFNLESQFDGRRKTAKILVQQVEKMSPPILE